MIYWVLNFLAILPPSCHLLLSQHPFTPKCMRVNLCACACWCVFVCVGVHLGVRMYACLCVRLYLCAGVYVCMCVACWNFLCFLFVVRIASSSSSSRLLHPHNTQRLSRSTLSVGQLGLYLGPRPPKSACCCGHAALVGCGAMTFFVLAPNATVLACL